MRHDDPHLGLYTDVGKRRSAAVQLASDVEGLRLVLASTVEERYRIRVADDCLTLHSSSGPYGLCRMAGLGWKLLPAGCSG